METMSPERVGEVSSDDLRSLIERPAGLCVSLIMPIQQDQPAQLQNPLRLENLLREAEQMLAQRAVPPAEAHKLLAPAWGFVTDRKFWKQQRRALAVYAAPGMFRVLRLPLDVVEEVRVGMRPRLAPLLPLLSGDGEFFLLALGLGGARLLRCRRGGMEPIPLADVPESLPDALKYDEFGKQPQLHAGIPGRGGERGAIFHGQGARDEHAVKDEIRRYFQQVERGVSAALRESRGPLVLAGVAYLTGIYREVNRYAPLAPEAIAHNPGDLTDEALHAQAWRIVAPGFDAARDAAWERYEHLSATDPARASAYGRAIVAASAAGRVEALFVADGAALWGAFEPDSGLLMVAEAAGPRVDDLIDVAIAETLRHGGAVFLAPATLPEGAPLAAILRY